MLEIGWISCFLSGMLFKLGDWVISFFTSLTSLTWFIDGIIPQSSVLDQGQWTVISQSPLKGHIAPSTGKEMFNNSLKSCNC